MSRKLNVSVGSLIVLVAAAMLSGCSMGDAPAGMTEADAKAAVDALPPDQKIKAIESSPMPEADKRKRIAEIKAAAGMK
ncbi:MAG: hypothetical protein ACO1SV_11880 [Fimbriimonas sp.]